MSENIILSHQKRFVGYCIPILLIILLVLLFQWFISDQRWGNVLIIAVAINCGFLMSFLASLASYDHYKNFFPRTISIKENSLYVTYPNSVYAIQAGYKEVYLLSECIWYKGYIDGIVLLSYGVCFFPIYFKPGIIIFHKPTAKQIECGFTLDSYNKWCCELEQVNIRECRKISRFFPLVTLLSAIIGIWLGLVIVCGLGCFWNPLVQLFVATSIPAFLIILGGYICGYDDIIIRFSSYCFHIVLYVLLLTVLYVVSCLVPC